MSTLYRVIAHFGAAVAVQDDSGEVHKAVPLSKVPALVTGDLVQCEMEAGGSWRVTRLCDRSTVLSRPDRRGQPRALAANISHLAIVSALPPGIDSLLIDQFCVAAELAGIKPMIVINKSDLLDDIRYEDATGMLEVYRRTGYSTVMVNTKVPGALQALHDELAGKTVVLVGASGVGKSSIVNRLLPDQHVRVGAVSDATGLGAHTTTVTFWYDLPGNSAIIDSPGVRQFSVAHLTPEDVREGYREIANAAQQCRFNNCSHVVEPGCAVTDAVATGDIARWRFENYRKLAEL